MRFVFLFILFTGVLFRPSQAIDCLEPGTRVISRWTNGNYYKGEVESLTNRINVLFDTGARHSYNTRDYEDIVLDRIPDPTELPWGNQILVNRPRSRAFEIGYIRAFKNGRFVILYEIGDVIHHTLDQIRTFNSSRVCDEPAYLGCYRDQVPRYLEVFVPTHPSTIGACVEACKSQRFSIAGLRNSDLCFCGNQYTKNYQTDEKQCDMPCYDNGYETCGGYMAFSQYWTGLVDNGQNVIHTGQRTFSGSPQTVSRGLGGDQRHSIPQYGQIPWPLLIQARSQFRDIVTKQARARNWNPAWRGRSWGGRSGPQRSFVDARARTSNQGVYASYGPGRPRYPVSAPARYRTYSPRQYTWPYNYYNKPRGQTSWKRPIQGTYSTYRGQTSWKRPIQGTYSTYRGPQRYTPGRSQTTTNQAYRSFSGPQRYNPGMSQTTTNQSHRSFSDSLRAVGWKLFGPKSKVFPSSANAIDGFRYAGCFKDSSIRDLPVAMEVRPLTIRSCVQKCRTSSYSVAGVQSSSQCFCGDSYSRYGRLRNEKCTMRCTGNYSEICGGEMKNNVFFTGYGTATPYEDLRAVRLKHPQMSASKTPSRTTSASAKPLQVPAVHETRTSGPADVMPGLELKLLVNKVHKDLDLASKEGGPGSKELTFHSLTTGKATNKEHTNKTSTTSKKPLTHKQLKTVLAVLSQWPSVKEKPKFKKPIPSFKRLKAILDDMTPEFIKILAYRIVAGKRRGQHRKKAGKLKPDIGGEGKTISKAIQSRLLGSKTNGNKTSKWELSNVKYSKGNVSKSNSSTTKSHTGAKAIGLRLWNVKPIGSKPSKFNASKIKGFAAKRIESIGSGSKIPNDGSVRTKDHGKEDGSRSVLMGSGRRGKNPLEKSRKTKKGKSMNETRDGTGSIISNENHASLSPSKSAGKSRENGVNASANIEDDVVEIIGQTGLSKNESRSNILSSFYDNSTTMATEQLKPSLGNSLNMSYVSKGEEGSGKEPTREKWKHDNATRLFSLNTSLALEAGDKRNKISRVVDDHATKPTSIGKKRFKTKDSVSISKTINKGDKVVEGNLKPHNKVINLKDDKSPGEKTAGVKIPNKGKTTKKSINGALVDGKSKKKKVGMVDPNLAPEVSKVTSLRVATKKEASQKFKMKQSSSVLSSSVVQVKKSKEVGQASDKKTSRKPFTKSKTASKDVNVSGIKAEQLKKASQKSKMKQSSSVISSSVVQVKKSKEVGQASDKKLSRKPFTKSKAASKEQVNVSGTKAEQLKKASQKSKMKQSSSVISSSVIQVKKSKEVGQASDKKTSRKPFTKSKTASKDENVSGIKAEQLKKASQKSKMKQSSSVISSSVVQVKKSKEVGQASDKKLSRKPFTKSKAASKEQVNVSGTKAEQLKKASQKSKMKQSSSVISSSVIQVKKSKAVGQASDKKLSRKQFTKAASSDVNVSGVKAMTAEQLKKTNLVGLYSKQKMDPKGQNTRTVKIVLKSRGPQEEADTENLDDSNSQNQLIWNGSHLSRKRNAPR